MKTDWLYLIANILKFYEGGITYRDIMQMTFYEVRKWERFAKKINAEIEAKIKK